MSPTVQTRPSAGAQSSPETAVRTPPSAPVHPQPPQGARSRKAPWHGSLDLIIRSLLEILVVSIFAVTFVAQPFRIPSASMEPTLRVGDCVLGDKQAFAPEGLIGRVLPPTLPQRGDLAIFHFPPDPSHDLVKRIVGLPGDRIRLQDGRLFLNGQPLSEEYAFFSPGGADPFRDNFPFLRGVDPNVDPAWWSSMRQNVREGEITVPAGHFFVLGDNRNQSEDSRYWGFVPGTQLVARPLVVYLGAPSPDAATPLGRLRSAFTGFRIVR